MRSAVAGAVAAIALGVLVSAQAPTPATDWATAAMTRLAVDLAPIAPVDGAELRINGKLMLRVYDRFRIAAAQARAAHLAGAPIDAAAVPPAMTVAQTLIVVTAGSPDRNEERITVKAARPTKKPCSYSEA